MASRAVPLTVCVCDVMRSLLASCLLGMVLFRRLCPFRGCVVCRVEMLKRHDAAATGLVIRLRESVTVTVERSVTVTAVGVLLNVLALEYRPVERVGRSRLRHLFLR